MSLLLAEIDPLSVAGTVCAAACVAMIVWWVVAALTTEDLEQDDEWRYDVSRINALRRLDPMYRLFQPLIQIFAKLNRAAVSSSLPEVYRQIQAAGLPRYWLPEEYLARCELLALLLAPAYFFLCITYMGIAGTVTASMLTVITAWLL